MRNDNAEPDLTLVGDVCPARKVGESLARLGEARVATRLRAVLGPAPAVGNLECPLCDVAPRAATKADGGPNLHAPPRRAAWLRRAGFRAMSLANNHIMDCGPEGLAGTLDALGRAGIRTVGAGANLDAALAPLIIRCRRGCVAMLAFGNGPPAGRRTPGVAPFNSSALARGLRGVPAYVDATVVLVHAGLEFLEWPESWLRSFAGEALAGGADLVACCHPHCLRGTDRTAYGVVLYGLGDFMMDTSDPQLLQRHRERTALTRLGFEPTGTRHCREGLAADVVFSRTGRTACRLRPVTLDEDFLPCLAEGVRREEITGRIRALSRPIHMPRSREMLTARRIEKAYRREYGYGGGLREWLARPLRRLRATLAQEAAT